jgi:hypothetical protein
VLFHHSPRERDEIECRAEVALHKIGFRPGQLGQLADLDLAILRQGADRNDRRLAAPEQRDDDLPDGTKLKDGAVAGVQANLKQRSGQRFRQRVNLGERQAAIIGRDVGDVRPLARGLAQHFAEGRPDPGAAAPISLGLAGRVIGHTIDRKTHPVHAILVAGLAENGILPLIYLFVNSSSLVSNAIEVQAGIRGSSSCSSDD